MKRNERRSPRPERVDVAIVGAGSAGLAAVAEVRKSAKSFVVIDGGPLGTLCARRRPRSFPRRAPLSITFSEPNLAIVGAGRAGLPKGSSVTGAASFETDARSFILGENRGRAPRAPDGVGAAAGPDGRRDARAAFLSPLRRGSPARRAARRGANAEAPG